MMSPIVPSPFLLLGEPLALDLVNTLARRDGADVDLLDRSRALDQWLHAEHSRVAWRGRVSGHELAAVRDLRDAIDPLLRASLSHQRGSAVAVRKLNRALALPAPEVQLAWNASGPRKPSLGAGAYLATLLRQLAMSALDLLTGPDADRVRQCAHPSCVLLFLARNPRRRWCSSATCGNRARVSRHYHKTTA
ncbi:MAG TPA: ABATE domain-containing protein [Nevskiaceae bacterium]|nr:ABATE domain-containing protein [Nevskiaceae bacterium]